MTPAEGPVRRDCGEPVARAVSRLSSITGWAAWLLALWHLGVRPEVTRLISQGPTQAAPAGTLGVWLALLAAFITWQRSWASRIMAIAVVAVAGLLTASDPIGYSPTMIALAFFLSTVLVIDRAHPKAGGPPRRLAAAVTGVAILGFASRGWGRSADYSFLALLPVSVAAGAIAARWPALDKPVEMALELSRRITTAAAQLALQARAPARSLLRRADRALLVWSICASVPALLITSRLASDRSQTIFGANDYSTHLEAVDVIQFWPPFIGAPHMVFHVLTRLVAVFLPIAWAAAVVIATATAALTYQVGCLARDGIGKWPGLPSVLAGGVGALATFGESPIAVYNSVIAGVPSTFAPTHVWYNPTDSLGLPISLALVVYTSRHLDHLSRPWRQPSRATLKMAGLVLVLSLTKPSFALVFAPGTLLFLAATNRRSRIAFTNVLVWLGGPVVLVTAYQFIHLRTNSWALAGGSNDYGVTLDPLALVEVYGWTRGGLGFWLGVVLVILAATLGGRAFRSWSPMALTFASTMVGLPPLLLLRETGGRAPDGNFAKSAQFGWMLLAILSIVALSLVVRESFSTQGAGRRSKARGALALVALTAWALGGTATLLDFFGAIGGTWPPYVVPTLR